VGIEEVAEWTLYSRRRHYVRCSVVGLWLRVTEASTEMNSWQHVMRAAKLSTLLLESR